MQALIYKSIKEASEKLNIIYSTLKGVVQKKKINKYNICYLYLKNEILEKIKQEHNG